MEKEITFEQIKEFLEFALRNAHNITTDVYKESLIFVFNKDFTESYIIYKSDKNRLIIKKQLLMSNLLRNIEVGMFNIEVNDIQCKEFELLISKIKEANNIKCKQQFNLDFFK